MQYINFYQDGCFNQTPLFRLPEGRTFCEYPRSIFRIIYLLLKQKQAIFLKRNTFREGFQLRSQQSLVALLLDDGVGRCNVSYILVTAVTLRVPHFINPVNLANSAFYLLLQ